MNFDLIFNKLNNTINIFQPELATGIHQLQPQQPEVPT